MINLRENEDYPLCSNKNNVIKTNEFNRKIVVSDIVPTKIKSYKMESVVIKGRWKNSEDVAPFVEIPIICLRTGLPLYHLTSRNIPENEEAFEEATYQLPPLGQYGLDLIHPKYFSLTEYHPFYYGADPAGYLSVALKYETSKDIILLNSSNPEWKTFMDIPRLERTLLENRWTGIDGWLALDDPGGDADSDWREIMLTRPYESIVKKPVEYLLSEDIVKDIEMNGYHWGGLETNIINEFTQFKGVFYAGIFESKMVITES